MLNRRVIALGLLGSLIGPLVGCMSQPLRPVNADGTYCFTVKNMSRFKICTPEPVPAPAVEAEVKRFEPDPEALTLYVVRKRWADSVNLVAVSLDGHTPVTTIPASLIRARLKPGEHRLALKWDGRSTELMVSGSAGQVRFVELAGSAWAWGSAYRWDTGSAESLQQLASSAKLIADLDLRR